MGSAASTSLRSANTRPSFYFVGDSITEYGSISSEGGFISLLQSEYVRSVDMINRGLSGYNTRMVVQHVLPTLENELKVQFTPSLVTLWLGANDAALPDGPNGNQNVPIDEYRSRLATIVNSLEAHLPKTSKVLMITPPTIIDSVRTGKDRSNAAAGEYASACVEVARAKHVAVLDLHSYISSAYPNETARKGLFKDGIHLSDQGNKLVANLLDDKIKEIFSDDDLKRFHQPQFKVYNAWLADSSSEFVPSASPAPSWSSSIVSYFEFFFGFD